jgi:hypothetical protein
MTRRSWIRNLFARRVTRPIRKKPPRARPTLEALEDRLPPATLTVNTLLDETTADSTLSLREAINVVNSGSTAGLSPAEMAQISGTLGVNDTIQFDSSLAGGTISLSGTQLELSKTNETVTITGPAAGVTVSGNLKVIYPANNGFEVPDLGAGGSAYGYGSPEAVAAGLPALPPGSGWTFTGTAGIAANGSNFGVNGASNGNSDGTTSTSGQAAFIQGYAFAPFNFPVNSMSQTFGGFNSGFAAVTFSLEQRPGLGDNPIDVQLDGQDLGAYLASSSSSFETFTTPAIPVTAGNHTLSFISTNNSGGDNTQFIDNVSVLNNPTRVFQIDSLVTASISGVTITGGMTGGYGGGLYNLGTATLTNCTVSGNSAGTGGGIFNNSTLALTDTTVEGNTSGSFGGGISTFGPTTITGGSINQNSASFAGGAMDIFTSAAMVTISGTAIQSNTAGGNGGGINNNFGPTLSLTSCSISGNTAGNYGGGIYNESAALTLSNNTVSSNSAGNLGGGIENNGGSTLTVSGSTFSGNFAFPGGGGISDDNGSTLTVTNCTFSGNHANGFGGGLRGFSSTLTLTNCTVSGNSAGSTGGIGNAYSSSTITLTNTIVAGNSGGDFSGSFSGSYNLIGGNPLLAPLGSYGGPTQTMALLPGSRAIGAGTATGAPSTDQRGFPLNSPVDIGAFQTQTPPLVVNTTDDTATGAEPDGDLSLRDAINLANALSGAETITFDSTVFATPQTITLAGRQLELTDTTGTETIAGPAAALTVSGGGLSRVFQVDGPVTASISGLTITGGMTGGDGGGLYNLGMATLTNCIVTGNSAGTGGGIANQGTLTVDSSTISKNTATSASRPAGLDRRSWAGRALGLAGAPNAVTQTKGKDTRFKKTERGKFTSAHSR